MIQLAAHAVKAINFTVKRFPPGSAGNDQFWTVNVTGTTREGEQVAVTFFLDDRPEAALALGASEDGTKGVTLVGPSS